MEKTKQQLVLEALQANTEKGLTAAQIRARLGVGNPRAEISRLRFQGYAIYANRHTDTKGREKTFYRIGRASRELIAAGYRALAAGI